MKIGFIGFGNLAKALCSGLLSKEGISASDICITAKTEQTLEYARNRGHKTFTSIKELIDFSDIVIIAVKPKVFQSILTDLPKNFCEKRFVSVMAMFGYKELKKVFPNNPVLRIMPSLSSYTASDLIGVCGEIDKFDDFIGVLSNAGKTIEMTEDKLDAFTVAESCGLGFAAYIMDEYKKAVCSLGFLETEAKEITQSVFSNSSLAENYRALYTGVATKGGATEAGISAMSQNGLDKAIFNGVIAAYNKAKGKK